LPVVACALVALASFACDDDRRAIDPTTAPSTVAPAPQPTALPVTTLLFTGDIIPARCTYTRLEQEGFRAAFFPLHDQLASAGATIGTLDSTISVSGRPIGCTPTFNLAAPAAALDALTYGGFDVIAHAANHIKDCGAVACGDDAMFETIYLLRSAGIATAGSGGDLAAARAPAVITRDGVRYAFLAYDDIAPYYHASATSPGSAPLDPDTVAADIANARALADVVIIIPHWGVEYTSEPTERQRAFARAAAGAGADLVIGNHPHWVQAHEQIGRTFVAYALGNFLFDQAWSRETQQGAMLEVTFTAGRMTGYRYIPVHIHEQYQPRIAEPAEAWEILGRIESASNALLP